MYVFQILTALHLISKLCYAAFPKNVNLWDLKQGKFTEAGLEASDHNEQDHELYLAGFPEVPSTLTDGERSGGPNLKEESVPVVRNRQEGRTTLSHARAQGSEAGPASR
ncbi:hypothetical protein CROQUDRAFT_92394, partial [Cronartium quercuum f. sp. fusiforme G11]